MIGNRIQTLDGGTSYHAIAAIEQVLEARLADDQFGNTPYGATVALPDGREFVYCYTALATILFGGCVCIDKTGGAASGQNPRATIPATTDMRHKFGIAAQTAGAAGGVWVQTYGRCSYARVDGATNIAIGAFLKPVDVAQYITYDHATVAILQPFAIFERCRHGDGGATKWAHTWETVADFPWYTVPETLAYGDQFDTTNADPAGQIFLTGNRLIVA